MADSEITIPPVTDRHQVVVEPNRPPSKLRKGLTIIATILLCLILSGYIGKLAMLAFTDDIDSAKTFFIPWNGEHAVGMLVTLIVLMVIGFCAGRR